MEEKENSVNKKSVIVGIVVLLVIIFSFWMSLSLGKKVFVPIKPLEETAQVSTPEESFLTLKSSEASLQTPEEVKIPEIEVEVTPVEKALATKEEKAVSEKKVIKKVAVEETSQKLEVEQKETSSVEQPSRPKKAKIGVKKEEAVKPQVKKNNFYYKVLAGSFTKEINARQIAVQLKNKGFSVYIDRVTVGGQKFFRVQIGAFTSQKEAEILLSRLKAKGFEGAILIE